MTSDASQVTQACAICGEAMAAAMSAECNWCNRRYHLNQRNDADGKDCGKVWIDEQYLALQFACDACLAGADPARGVARKTAARPVQAGRRRRYRRRA